MFIPGSNPIEMIGNHALLAMFLDEQDNGPGEFSGMLLLMDLDRQWNNPLLTAMGLRTIKNKGYVNTRPCDCREDCLNTKVSLTQTGREQAAKLNEEIKVIQAKIEAKWGPIAQVEQAVKDGTISMQEIVDYVGPRPDPSETPPLEVEGVVVLDLTEEPALEPSAEEMADAVLDELAERLKTRRYKSGTWGATGDPGQN